MAVQIPTHCLQGLSVLPVQMEVDVSAGMPIFSIIGLAGTSVQESKDRVRSAIVHSGFEFPLTRKVVNLAPAELGKQGSHFDLPMALGFLMASGQMGLLPEDMRVMGELGLDGSVRPVSSVLPAILFAREQGTKEVILPCENLAEASLVEGIKLTGVSSLCEVVAYLEEERLWNAGHFLGNSVRRQYAGLCRYFRHAPAKRRSSGGRRWPPRAYEWPTGQRKSLLAEAFPGCCHHSIAMNFEVLRIYSIAGRTLITSPSAVPFGASTPASPLLLYWEEA